MHQPIVRSTFQKAGPDDESLGALGPGDDAQAQAEPVAGPVDEVAGVAAVGPGLGDLRLGEMQPPEHIARGVTVLDVGGRALEAYRLRSQLPCKT
ncbi:hypothetical protein ACIOHE_04305 [Streptomyces sp. NPDC087851]|uniref:hypothetical protein n=1 Tax=Streptomyces sp. NPDC087851 TaxID=3365810 RepID=UPI0037FFF809